MTTHRYVKLRGADKDCSRVDCYQAARWEQVTKHAGTEISRTLLCDDHADEESLWGIYDAVKSHWSLIVAVAAALVFLGLFLASAADALTLGN